MDVAVGARAPAGRAVPFLSSAGQYFPGCNGVSNETSCIDRGACGDGTYVCTVGRVGTGHTHMKLRCRLSAFETLVGCGGTSPGYCQSCTDCPVGEYRRDCTSACEPCVGCAEGEYRVGCGRFGPGLCEACPACLRNQYRAGCQNDTSGHCTPCPICQTTEVLVGCGGAAAGICVPKSDIPAYCPLGMHYSDGGFVCPCISICPLNSSSVGVSTNCTPCARGQYAPQGSSACTDCPPGTRMQYGEGGGCPECGAGTYSETYRAAYCLQCPPGKFNNATGMSVCYDCGLVRRSRV
ncbi:hypothetical protein GUITHDRAFT_149311 [Guillardia theta CCMP2712]|uniref:TNFR-Cys domain-containing protein n=1 Tax=Guillardia theta (strain CCMP2712) TaxID=905079 RepID=L1I599_GUITC|nr:hypothetical protein GUITHDRAFT_149311 [Guillardia theta CCMP2712]EKX31401.1 hypothetical protein GUITHDRAFT_149311 [Guillardia theta CCMP2712]|eukprot:XP_005818381.1 hypothetical protein GUITHDRAFT_149311 [Guillardia theta CCMP2712]